jgi:hypothetical protein
MCSGNEQKLTNFELCQQYFKTIAENTKTRAKLPSDIREIAKVGIVKDKASDDDRLPSGNHRVREAQATGIVRIGKEDKETNLADVLTKCLPGPQLRELCSRVLL